DIVSGQGGGTVAISADGSRVVWAPTGAPVSYSTDNGASWNASSGIPQGAAVASDRVNGNKFYGYGQGQFWISTDGGASFTASTATGMPEAGDPAEVKAVPGHEGDVWVAGGSSTKTYGLWHSTDGGATFTKLNNVAGADHIGFGMPAPGNDYVSLYAVAVIDDLHTLFRSDDGGASWIQITDSQHMFATIQTVTGDPRIYGRVYIGTNGLGALYGDFIAPLPTAVPTETSTTLPTSTPTVTPTDPGSGALDLLINGSFEEDTDNNKIPDNWNGKNLSGDKRKCNKPGKIIALDGECLFQFKGSVGENSKLIQKSDETAVIAGDTITLGGFVIAKGKVNNRIQVRVNYADTSIPSDKITIKLDAAVPDWTPLTGILDLTLADEPAAIKVMLHNKGISGKVWLDDMSLKVNLLPDVTLNQRPRLVTLP
ncbi:MAG TPA: sialidase family protein, partial [Phototrophicaceae bacterium]|nr:sialidase family protein [Phototrophicaceae bacterium]